MPVAARTNVVEVPWTDLLLKVRQGECVPFIGAGASFPALPLAADLAEQLLAEDEQLAGRKCPLVDRGDLAKVCQYLAVTHKDGGWPKKQIAARLERLTPPDFDDPAEPHRALANLRLPIYITTNYDNFMFQALQKAGAKPRQEFARWTKTLLDEEHSTFDDGYRPTPEEPVVFHIHGHTGHYSSMVASEDDYLDFLVNMSKEISRNPRTQTEPTWLPLPIRRAMRHNRLLFVGYGLADINFRVILRSLLGSQDANERQVHLSIQYAGASPQDLEDYLKEYFRWILQLDVFWGSAQDFARELVLKWK